VHEQAAGLIGGALAGRLVHVDGHDRGSLGGQPAQAGQPDAAARAGDHGDSVLQALHVRALSFLCADPGVPGPAGCASPSR